jgi:hypothetical protein
MLPHGVDEAVLVPKSAMVAHQTRKPFSRTDGSVVVVLRWLDGPR